MRFNAQVVVTGIKRSKGEFEGAKYDSTKFYIQTDLDDSKGNSRGMATVEYSMGDSEEYAAYEKLPLPFTANAVFNQVTTGKVTKITLESLSPVVAQKAA